MRCLNQILLPNTLVNEAPNYIMALPALISRELLPGSVGLAVAALLAAAMSSLDSVITSLSATTLKDFIKPMMAHRIVTPEQSFSGEGRSPFSGVCLVLFTAFMSMTSLRR